MKRTKEFNLSKEEFYKRFESDRYKNIGRRSPDLDWQEAHIEFVWDTEEEKTVGYVRTSSWGAPTHYAYIESREETEEEKESREDALRKLEELRKNAKPYTPPENPGLYEFLESESVQPYEWKEGALENFIKSLESVWEDKLPQKDRKVTLFRYCKTKGWVETSETFLSICGDPTCSSCALMHKAVLDV